MLINETSKLASLTKKAIEYYVEQGLISPIVLENGYRDFSKSDVEKLKKISVLRKLGLGTEDIKMVLCDETGTVLQKFAVQKELHIKREQSQKALLEKLGKGESYAIIANEIMAIEQSATIIEKLLEGFPGYYGQFICLHFARFLNEPISTNEQMMAYKEIISFLDSVPPLVFPEDLQEYLIEGTKHITAQNISAMLESVGQAYENPDRFIAENKEVLEDYLAFKQSEEYKNSPAPKLMELMREFNSSSGYYDVFIPQMKKLSAQYANYHVQIELANKKMLDQYPDMTKLS